MPKVVPVAPVAPKTPGTGTLQVRVVGQPGDQKLATQVTVLDVNRVRHAVAAPGSIELPAGTTQLSVAVVAGYEDARRTVNLVAGESLPVLLSLKATQPAQPTQAGQPAAAAEPSGLGLEQVGAAVSAPVLKARAATVTISPPTEGPLSTEVRHVPGSSDPAVISLRMEDLLVWTVERVAGPRKVQLGLLPAGLNPPNAVATRPDHKLILLNEDSVLLLKRPAS